MTYLEQRLKEIDTEPAFNVNGRKEKFTEQLIQQGFHDGDTFSLDVHLAELILPRLKRYKELAERCICITFPLDEMIEAFDLLVKSNGANYRLIEEDREKIHTGLKHLVKTLWLFGGKKGVV